MNISSYNASSYNAVDMGQFQGKAKANSHNIRNLEDIKAHTVNMKNDFAKKGVDALQASTTQQSISKLLETGGFGITKVEWTLINIFGLGIFASTESTASFIESIQGVSLASLGTFAWSRMTEDLGHNPSIAQMAEFFETKLEEINSMEGLNAEMRSHLSNIATQSFSRGLGHKFFSMIDEAGGMRNLNNFHNMLQNFTNNIAHTNLNNNTRVVFLDGISMAAKNSQSAFTRQNNHDLMNTPLARMTNADIIAHKRQFDERFNQMMRSISSLINEQKNDYEQKAQATEPTYQS